MEEKEKILQVKDLTISFRTGGGMVRAVRDISFDLYKGETLAIVGESGSGKSVTARSLMGILAPNAVVDGGSILYEDTDLLKLPESEFHRYRGNKLGMIFQDPLSSLNPIMKVGKQLTESMRLNGKISRKDAKARALELLASIPDLDTKEKLESIPGTPPNMLFPPKGDTFAARNKYAMAIDFEEQPPLFQISPTHYAATWLLHPNAPKVDPPEIVTQRIRRMQKLGGELDGN